MEINYVSLIEFKNINRIDRLSKLNTFTMTSFPSWVIYKCHQFKRGGSGNKEMEFCGNFQGVAKGGMSFMDDPLHICNRDQKYLIIVQSHFQHNPSRLVTALCTACKTINGRGGPFQHRT